MTIATATELATFTVGETYVTRFATDHSHALRFTVAKRTAKFVTLIRDNGADGETLRVGVKTDDQGEWVLPLGSYSMAPVLRANRAA